MSTVCAPVAVVTTSAGAEPYGTTVSSFTSLSMDPPMLLVSLSERSQLLGLVRQTGIFGVNVLSSAQAGLAAHFARASGKSFEGLSWEQHDGLPRLQDAAAWVGCVVDQFVRAGDHTLLLGTIRSIMHSPDAEPLVYYRRQFGTYAAPPRS